MTYSTIAAMHDSNSLKERLTACAATLGSTQPESFVWANQWALVSTPGWSDPWDAAAAAPEVDPGADQGVITDAMILAAVQPLLSRSP